MANPGLAVTVFSTRLVTRPAAAMFEPEPPRMPEDAVRALAREEFEDEERDLILKQSSVQDVQLDVLME